MAARFLTRVRREMQRAFLEAKESSGVTQAQLARKLGVGRAVVCRQLAGTASLTLRTIADYAWALDRDLIFEMPPRRFADTASSEDNATPKETGSAQLQRDNIMSFQDIQRLNKHLRESREDHTGEPLGSSEASIVYLEDIRRHINTRGGVGLEMMQA